MDRMSWPPATTSTWAVGASWRGSPMRASRSSPTTTTTTATRPTGFCCCRDPGKATGPPQLSAARDEPYWRHGEQDHRSPLDSSSESQLTIRLDVSGVRVEKTPSVAYATLDRRTVRLRSRRSNVELAFAV
jgi:hypothetical protein